jgi:hypothetical protein
MKPVGEFKCPNCGRVHMGILEADAVKQVADVNAYLETLAPAQRHASYGDRVATIDRYLRCFHCGAPSSAFVPAQPGDAPIGSTLHAVIAPTSG